MAKEDLAIAEESLRRMKGEKDAVDKQIATLVSRRQMDIIS